MAKKSTKKMRLDELLVSEGLVSDDQIREALKCQKEHGGKIGSHLMRLGFVNEQDLVKILAKKYNCDGVVLSELEIASPIVQMLAAEVATARRVIPFDYVTDRNVLKIACEDPNDKDLIKELKYVVGDKEIELYVAAELALKATIATHYMSPGGASTQFTESGSLPIADVILSEGRETVHDAEQVRERGVVLLVCDDTDEGPKIRALLEQQRYLVMTIDSADDAIDLIKTESFDIVFIKDTVPGDYIDLIDRLRKKSPDTCVRYFESAASLLVDPDNATVEAELMAKNLDLFTSILASGRAHDNGHSMIVGQHVDRLCRQLGIPAKERLLITNAGYLHDLSKYYYGPQDVPEDPRSQIDLTIKLLDSLGYSPVVVEILRSTYINLRSKYTKRLPIEVLGGNIVTIVDIFCDNIQVNEKLSLDKFEAIRKKFDELTGKLFLSEVVSAFIDMIQVEVLKTQQEVKFGQVMIYGEEKAELGRVERALQAEGFRTISQDNYQSFIELFGRSQPNMMILMASGQALRMMSMVEDLTMRGIDVSSLPTFILAKASLAPALTTMFDRGIEDIIVLDESLDMLLVKMKKVRVHLEDAADSAKIAVSTGTRGTLQDMNLIDLLQAMGPSRKTAKLVIQPVSGKELTIYLEQGCIIYAAYQGKVGAEAVYEGISWGDGTWTLEPIAVSDLPEPNNELQNESILMEGCRLLDESQHIPVSENPQ